VESEKEFNTAFFGTNSTFLDPKEAFLNVQYIIFFNPATTK
jgi:hypothetical protein